MSEPRTNELGLPIGTELPGWVAPAVAEPSTLTGRWTRLERLDVERHAPDLWREFAADREDRMWTYLPWGPFADQAELERVLAAADGGDRRFYAIVDPEGPEGDGPAVGVLALLRIDPPAGSIEVGAIMLSPRAQRTRLATEAVFLLADHVFDLGYRRFEWKCDALNARSRRAAERFGFVYEGTFRQATVYKGRSRDTAWFAVVDGDWPRLRAGYEAWLDPANFDEAGRQRRSLGMLMG